MLITNIVISDYNFIMKRLEARIRIGFMFELLGMFLSK